MRCNTDQHARVLTTNRSVRVSNQEIHMSYPLKKSREIGFTLMELMVVVVIIGTLSAVAVPTLIKFIRKSRESEATLNIAAIARGAQQYFQQDHVDNATGVILPSQYPNSTKSKNRINGFASTPTQLPCKQTVGSPKYRGNSAQWHVATDPWEELKFSIPVAHYFQYGFFENRKTGINANYTIRARADLDCDGKLSSFRIVGKIDAATSEQVRGGVFVINAGE